MSLGIVGAGAFGSAMAIVLGDAAPVVLWGRDSARMAELKTTRVPQMLPDATLPDTVTPTSDLERLRSCDTVLICVPTQTLRGVLADMAGVLDGTSIVCCCKGFDAETLAGSVDTVAREIPSARGAMLTGPSFASDLARGLPTALTLACQSETRGAELQGVLSRPRLRLYRTTDVIGAQFGGAVKNVIAIAAGVAIGSGFGDSARAALVTRGIAEMQSIALHMGAKPDTLMGLSGLGDLILTSTSPQSRNFRFGLSRGKEESFDPAVTVEGIATARALQKLATRHLVDMPVTQAVCELIDGRATIPETLSALLERPLKQE